MAMPALYLSSDVRAQLASATEHAWCAAWAALSYFPSARVIDLPELVCVLTIDSPDLLHNAVVRYRQAGPVSIADIERVLAPFRTARHPLQWWLRLGSEPAGLRQRLHEIGFQTWSEIPGMALPLSQWQPPAPPAPGIDVRQAATLDEIGYVLRIVATVYSAPPEPMWRWCGGNPRFANWLAYIDGEPVGAMASQVTQGICGIFHVATLPRWRRRGVAWAMMLAAIADARRQGAQIVALTATPEAESLYRRLGFTGVSSFEFWAPATRFLATL
jgi:ribosomal protein S18 acetylase RimI-like enzyme